MNNDFRLSFKLGEEVKYVKIIQEVHFNYTYFYILFSLDMKSISQLMWNGKVCDNIWGKKDEKRTEAKQRQDAGEGEEDGEDERLYILRSFKTTVFLFCVRE